MNSNLQAAVRNVRKAAAYDLDNSGEQKMELETVCVAGAGHYSIIEQRSKTLAILKKAISETIKQKRRGQYCHG